MGKNRQSALPGPRTESSWDMARDGPMEAKSMEAASVAAAAMRRTGVRRVGEAAASGPWKR